MPSNDFDARVSLELDELRRQGQYKYLKYLRGPMGPVVDVEGQGEVVMLCSNDYLGLANHSEVVAAGIKGLNDYGAGTASVRFIAGTTTAHRLLEDELAAFAGTESALTFVSAWCANEALFPTMVGPDDVVISDGLNHASLIDSIRQVRGASRIVFKHGDLDEVERHLVKNRTAAVRWVVTDGVFSMEGDIADLRRLVSLCRDYEAILVVDDSHGTGVLGRTGKGTHEHFGVVGEIDVLTGTLGKALGGGAGGYVAASKRVTEMLIQRGRPSLFSNALPSTIACSAAKAIEIVNHEPGRVEKLRQNVECIRDGLVALGYDCRPSPSAIIPIIVGETSDAIAKAERLFELGVMVTGFGYPVVPKGEARLRIQASAALEPEHIGRCLDAFRRL